MFRRVAAHHVDINGNLLSPCVVEILDGRVVYYYTFSDELPLTEWLGDTIYIKKEANSDTIFAEWHGHKIQ